jgi:hypothetical protein
MINIIYRLSNNSYTFKTKPSYVTKLNCLKNLLKRFADAKIHIVGDNLTDSDLKDFVASNPRLTIEFTSLGNAKSFGHCVSRAMEIKDDSQIVYLVEDDYIHREGAALALQEGFGLGADFVSLYDHPDKYMEGEGKNPYVEDGGEETKVFLTKSCHWKFTNSTTGTFAATVKTWRENYGVIKNFMIDRPRPEDFGMFLKLRELGKSLVTPIPGYSTHGETRWLAPLINWEKEMV